MDRIDRIMGNTSFEICRNTKICKGYRSTVMQWNQEHDMMQNYTILQAYVAVLVIKTSNFTEF